MNQPLVGLPLCPQVIQKVWLTEEMFLTSSKIGLPQITHSNDDKIQDKILPVFVAKLAEQSHPIPYDPGSEQLVYVEKPKLKNNGHK